MNIITLSSLNKKHDLLRNDFALSDTDQQLPEITQEYPSIIDAVVFGICVKGKGKISINLKPFEMEPNSIMVLLPGSILECDLKSMSKDFLMRYATFSFDFIAGFDKTELYTNIRANPCFKLQESDAAILSAIYDHLEKQYHTPFHAYKKEIVRHTLLAAVYEFCSLYEKNIPLEKGNANKEIELQDQFLDLVLSYYRTKREVKFYAEKLFLTPKYLSAKIKQLTNRSAVDWINESIILEAKALLKSTDQRIQAIAFHFNFPDASTFGKFFKRHVGISPKEYRLSSLLH